MDSFDIEEDLLLFQGMLHILKIKNKRLYRKRRIWVNSYLTKRRENGRYARDFLDLCNEPLLFKENFRVNLCQFEELYSLLGSRLSPTVDTRPNDKITAKEKLCMTLEYLASGGLERHIASCYRVSKQSIGLIIEETCQHIFEVLKEEHAKDLKTTDWIDVANKFHSEWNYPNCIGTLDGKHVQIRCPKNAGSAFFNFKGFHSIVLLALADANYRFLFIDVGAYGSESDSSVFQNSDFGKLFYQSSLNIPENRPVYGRSMPFVFLGDDAFPLHKNIMKPYKATTNRLTEEQRIFNYRLSRARRCVENAFGILCARWICLARPILSRPDKAQKIVLACCMLHNFLLNTDKDSYCPPDFGDSIDEDGNIIDGAWRRLVNEGSLINNNLEPENFGRPSNLAKRNRDHMKDYFNSDEGAIPWQNEAIFI